MLDTQTKKRIDDCRDILVGKLPDPKAQIEQITIGLIYKFMDDMDKEAIELGGSAKFFSGGYEKYAWDKLFDTKVTAAEMLRLYSEAIESMEKNPNIPQLFRDIFNNAYLPYRDPETLKLFLKTIGEFEYTHSEKLGDAFEYLLSVMGSQGDAGQFRTPRHVIDFLVAIIDPDKGETILDPACGTAGFLISVYKHILLKHTKANKEGLNIYEYNKLEKKPFNNLGDQLTPDDRKKLIQNFAGYDISPDMVRLSLVNLYLHGFSDPHINEYDTLSSEERWNENFDVVLANPPFMSPKGGIRPHKKFTINSNRSEVLFVDYIAEHLNPKGKAGIIVPEGVIFQSGKAYKELRKMLVDNYLYAVVSLPAGVFNPYSGVKTSILLMDKAIAKKHKEILFVKIANDGYNLGAQRTAVKGSQLEEAIALTHEFAATGEIPDSLIAHTVLRTEISASVDYNLSGDRYKITIDKESTFEWKEIGELVDLIKDGDWIESKDQSESGIRLIQTGNVGIGEYKDKDDKARFIDEDTFKRLNCTEIFPNDVLVSRLPDPVGRACLVPNLNIKMITAVDCSIIRFNQKKILPNLFVYYTKSDKYYDYIAPYLTGSSRSRISRKNLEKVKIPLPPLSIQEEIVAEIEGYQKIINGAKAVVTNYKPKIDIDPDWEMVELNSICDVRDGTHDSPKYVQEGGIPFITQKNITKEGLSFDNVNYISQEDHEKIIKRSNVEFGDIIFSMIGANRGMSCLIDDKRVFSIKNVGLIKPQGKAEQKFILYYLQSQNAQTYVANVSAGGAQSFVSLKNLRAFPIPLPDAETQLQIVAQIEKEQALVNANKQLIEIFEQKIKDRIAKVWGVEKEEEENLSMAAEPLVEYEKA
ncbi:MAG: restriction endonuclease subunit M/S [Bacteroidetes bacterium]|nr:MAG: restriction endonuclease subunit M/S [Bacteroidota bacterium]MBL1145100.1 restriction endonuclease subunit M/S [Bacteroidota bacterium]NOG57897.1 N-6 DNA methylase [Bacteroidota bacterium]